MYSVSKNWRSPAMHSCLAGSRPPLAGAPAGAGRCGIAHIPWQDSSLVRCTWLLFCLRASPVFWLELYSWGKGSPPGVQRLLNNLKVVYCVIIWIGFSDSFSDLLGGTLWKYRVLVHSTYIPYALANGHSDSPMQINNRRKWKNEL